MPQSSLQVPLEGLPYRGVPAYPHAGTLQELLHVPSPSSHTPSGHLRRHGQGGVSQIRPSAASQFEGRSSLEVDGDVHPGRCCLVLQRFDAPAISRSAYRGNGREEAASFGSERQWPHSPSEPRAEGGCDCEQKAGLSTTPDAPGHVYLSLPRGGSHRVHVRLSGLLIPDSEQSTRHTAVRSETNWCSSTHLISCFASSVSAFGRRACMKPQASASRQWHDSEKADPPPCQARGVGRPQHRSRAVQAAEMITVQRTAELARQRGFRARGA